MHEMEGEIISNEETTIKIWKEIFLYVKMEWSRQVSKVVDGSLSFQEAQVKMSHHFGVDDRPFYFLGIWCMWRFYH